MNKPKAQSAVGSTRLVMRHKTCPTWGQTQCGMDLWIIGKTNPETSYRWRDVTCPKCLKQKGHNAEIGHGGTPLASSDGSPSEKGKA